MQLLKIREATINDCQPLNVLYLQLNPSDQVVDKQEFKKQLQIISTLDWLKIFVCEVNSKIITTCYLNVIPNLTRGLKPYAMIENIVTDIEYRNRGYGKAIVKHTVNEAWDLGCYKVVILTGSTKKSTLEFYKNCGFKSGDKTAFIARPLDLKKSVL